MGRDRDTTTAFHEAGHAVLAWACGIEVTEVSVGRQGDTLGRVRFIPHDTSSREGVLRNALMGVGGIGGDFHHWANDPSSKPDEAPEGHWGDHRKVRDQLSQIGFNSEASFHACLTIGQRFLGREDIWPIVQEVAGVLLTAGALTSDQVELFSKLVPVMQLSDIKGLEELLEHLRMSGIESLID